jgi:hypothetical protein
MQYTCFVCTVWIHTAWWVGTTYLCEVRPMYIHVQKCLETDECMLSVRPDSFINEFWCMYLNRWWPVKRRKK